jgi:preprotein translocase subunit SecE
VLVGWTGNGPADSRVVIRYGSAQVRKLATQTHGQSAERSSGSGRADKRDRTTPALFTRQVAAELRKVIWPTRHELITYTTVALVFCILMAALVFGLDYGFARLMFAFFG